MSHLTLLLAAVLPRLHSLYVDIQAQKDSRVSRISDSFGTTPGADAAKIALLILALLIVGFFVVFLLRRLLAKATAKTDAETLFLKLCNAHELSKHDRELLQEVAVGMNEGYFITTDPDAPSPDTRANSPATIFVRKTLFSQAIAQETSNERKERLETLFRKLFA